MGKLGNETPTYSRNQGFAYYAVFDGNNSVTHEAWASPSSLTSEAKWQICKHTYVSGNLTRTQWAEGNDEFNFIADNYASITYS